MQGRQTFRFVALTALCLAVTPAAADDSPLAPADAVADRVNPTGVTGMYRCAVGDAATVRFSFTGFDDGQHRIEESLGGRDRLTARYPWQLATATLYRERVSGQGAAKFRRLTGSLRLLQELKPGLISANYAEAPLDGSTVPLEWRYDVRVKGRAASFAPSGLGEVTIVQIEEQRTRYVDAQQNPLALSEAAAGFDVTEVATVSYAPKLGLALRIERKREGRVIEACSLAEYKRG